MKSEAGEGGEPDAGGMQGASGDGNSSAGSGAAGGAQGGASGRDGGMGGREPQGGTSPIGGVGGLGGINLGGPSVRDGLALWLSADRGVTESNGDVSKWADQSGNGRNATQSAADERPRRVSVSGSRSMIEFDGTDDALSLADGFDDFEAGVSFFAAVEVLGMPTCSSLVQLSNGPEKDDIDFGIGSYSLAYEVDETYFRGPEAYELTQRIIAGVIHRTTTDGHAELRVDGEYLDANLIGTPTVTTRHDNFIGRSLYETCSPLHARIGELLLYQRALSDSERVEVEGYLRSRWQ